MGKTIAKPLKCLQTLCKKYATGQQNCACIKKYVSKRHEIQKKSIMLKKKQCNISPLLSLEEKSRVKKEKNWIFVFHNILTDDCDSDSTIYNSSSSSDSESSDDSSNYEMEDEFFF